MAKVSDGLIQTGQITLILGTSNFNISAQSLHLNSNLLIDHPNLQTYKVQSEVSSQTFEAFVRAIEEGSDLFVTADNFSELLLLCEEFGTEKQKRVCERFVGRVSVGSTKDLGFENMELEFEEQKVSVAELKGEIVTLREDLGRLGFEVGGLKESVSGLQRLQEDFRKLETNFRTQSGEIGTLKSQTEAVGQSVSRLENLRGEFYRLNQTVEHHHLGGLEYG
jgi:hypothetical protein